MRILLLLMVLLCTTKPAHAYNTTSNGTFFQLSTGVKEYDHAYEVALRELGANRDQRRGVYVAGAGWGSLWTRDSAYAIELAAGLIDPDFSAKTLLECSTKFDVGGRKNTPPSRLLGNVSLESLVEQTARVADKPLAWIQDRCGHFGAWPVLSDAIVGTQGAWALYLVQGDKNFLRKAYENTLTALHRAEVSVFDHAFTGLFKGCSSFMESNAGYPQRFAGNGKLVAQTKALSTNMLHYNGYVLGSRMAKELGHEEASTILLQKAKVLRDNIRKQMWLDKASNGGFGGYYSYVMDENNQLLPQMEGLGESFVLLAPDFEDDETRIQSMFENIQRTPKGIACLWPQFQHNWTGSEAMGLTYVFNSYHNGRIWPFVQGYWAMAAAKHGHVDIFVEELQNLMKLSQTTLARVKTDLALALDGTAFEMPSNVTDTFAEFYELDGTFRWSQRSQLWSDAGFLSMFFYGIFGLRLETGGIRFEPMKPSILFAKDRPISLRGIHYRNMTLDVVLHGSGTKVMSASADGIMSTSLPPFVDATLTGHHVLEIHMEEERKEEEHANSDATLTGHHVLEIHTEEERREEEHAKSEASSDDSGSDIVQIQEDAGNDVVSLGSFAPSPPALRTTHTTSSAIDHAFEEYAERLGMGEYIHSKEHVLFALLGWLVVALLLCRFLTGRARSGP